MVVNSSVNVQNFVTILNGETESSRLPFTDYAQAGFILPTVFTGTGVSFLVSANGEDFSPLYDSANALVSVTVTQGRAYAFPLSLFPFPWIKLVSNAAETGDRAIECPSKY